MMMMLDLSSNCEKGDNYRCRFLHLLFHDYHWLLGLPPAWNGSGVGGGADLRLRKGLLQLKNQKDFSHQAGVFRNFPLHNIFIYSGCVKSSQEDSRWSKMTWDYKGSVYRKDDSVRVPSKKLAGTFNIRCHIFVIADQRMCRPLSRPNQKNWSDLSFSQHQGLTC